jgi:hypothetical protein
MKSMLLILSVFCLSLEASAQSKAGLPLWTKILEQPEAKVPADPGGEVVWREDFSAALAEAQKSNRPILVTWRCLPCKQCAEFDKNVLEGSEDLDPLLRRFVTVRLIDAAQLDQRYFPYQTHQDLDLSWWGYFLRPDGALYGVFGGKDHVSDSTRISEKAFVNSLTRVLKHHYDTRRTEWNIDGPAPDTSAAMVGPKNTRGYELLLEKRPNMGKPHAEHGSCIHCHQVGDMQTVAALDAGSFRIEQLTQKWPLPENVGITLDRDDGLLVTDVEKDSAAQKAGVQTGDQLGMANGTRLFGQADFRGVLHRASFDDDTIPLGWTRKGEVMFGQLRVQAGWKATENWWRKTVYDGAYGPTMGFFPLKGPNAGKGKGLSIKPWMGKPPTGRPIYQTGLRPNMEIIAINGMSEDMDARKLIAWFRLNHKAGDEVTYTVKGGKEFKFMLPEE